MTKILSKWIASRLLDKRQLSLYPGTNTGYFAASLIKFTAGVFAADDTITFTKGVTSETYVFKASASGDREVTFSNTAITGLATTLTNLVNEMARMNSNWFSSSTQVDTGWSPTGVNALLLIEKSYIAGGSLSKAYGTFSGGNSNVKVFDFHLDSDYISYGHATIDLPSSIPATSIFGAQSNTKYHGDTYTTGKQGTFVYNSSVNCWVPSAPSVAQVFTSSQLTTNSAGLGVIIGGAKILFNSALTANDTISIDRGNSSETYTATSGSSSGNSFAIGSTTTESATNLAERINAQSSYWSAKSYTNYIIIYVKFSVLTGLTYLVDRVYSSHVTTPGSILVYDMGGTWDYSEPSAIYNIKTADPTKTNFGYHGLATIPVFSRMENTFHNFNVSWIQTPSAAVNNDISGYTGLLSSADTNVQLALNTIDLLGSIRDLTPYYKSTTQFSILSTSKGRKIKLNNKYFKLTTNLDITPSEISGGDGIYYICIDTSKTEGEIDSSYVVSTLIGPTNSAFNCNYAIIGEFTVSSSLITAGSLEAYSTREMTNWVNTVPNIKRATEQKTAVGENTLTTNFYAPPSNVIYRYWDNSALKFYDYSRTNIENSYTATTLTYTIPTGDPTITFEAGDYFEVEAEYYNYLGTGLASPKSDYSTDWYSTTPSSVVTHTLGSRPLAITFEFNSSGVYYFQDGETYINKDSGGTTSSQVTFDWVGLPTLSASLQMRIIFHVSKISAGAFEANTLERGTVKITGLSSTVESPDLIIDSTFNTGSAFATAINALSDDSYVYLKESVTVTEQQTITKRIKFRRKHGTKVICATAVTSIVKFSAECDIDLEIESQNDITNAIEFNAAFVAKLRIHQKGSGKTLTNGILINTGYKGIAQGLVTADVGTITNTFTDTDSLSIILIP